MGKQRDLNLRTNYCIRLWLLQEIAGCTFLEARLYLREERRETTESICRSYNITMEEAEVSIENARRKIEKASKSRNVFRGYTPIYPKDGDDTDW